jgi:cytochrome c peroxidase
MFSRFPSNPPKPGAPIVPWPLLVAITAFLLIAAAVASIQHGAGQAGILGPAAPAAQQEPIVPIPERPPLDPEKMALGELLFNDVRLSGKGTRSCASCHDLQTNGAVPPGSKQAEVHGLFDTVSVFNAALNFRLTWLGNVRTLEAQAEGSLQNPQIMGADIEAVLDRLKADRVITGRFWAAYGRPPDRENVLNALATFERSLLTPGSRFDRWLLGDRAALSEPELAGYQLFRSLGCVSCHQGVNVGGNLFEKPGIFRSLGTSPLDLVRVPSLRNVTTTAPYFHDGSAATLDDAIYRMASSQLNVTIDHEQVAALKAFLATLTGSYRDHQVRSAR